MGRMHITLNDIVNYLKSDINKYSEEQHFLDEFYKIGFKNRAHDVLDQNIDKYPKINFEYDDLKNIDLHLLNTNFQTFLNNEPFDDVLFDIAENHYGPSRSFLQTIKLFLIWSKKILEMILIMKH